MKRHALAVLVILSDCRAPDDALVASCQTSVLSLSTECELRATTLPASRSSYLDAHTKNFKVRVSATFTVGKGRVEAAIPGCAEGGRVQVEPGRPASLECDATISRSAYEFAVVARPLDGSAAAFAGKLSFRPI